MYAHAHARFLGGLMLLLALVLAPSLADASLYTTIVPAQTIQNVNDTTGSITVGGLVFSDFTLDTTTKNTGNAPDATSVSVEGVLLNGNYGLRFDGGWSVSGSQIVDTVIWFKVSALDGDLTDDHLWMSAGSGANGGIAYIDETLYLGPETEAISELNVYSYGIGQATQRVCVDTFDPPQPYLWVCKDINVNGGLTGVASISNFFQTFSVPEPCTLLVLAVGGALALRSKRH